MKKMIVLTFVFVLLAISLFGCAATNTETIGESNSRVNRVVDYDAGVVCWTFYVYKGGGISCLPIDETLLQE